jgi:hypothetical protein
MINSLALIGAGVWTLVVAVAVAVGVYIFVKHNPRKVSKIDEIGNNIKNKLK